MQDVEYELLLQQQIRCSRLRASTALTGTLINFFLMEYTPANRVFSGEVIVFQNEMIEIFKELLSVASPSKESRVKPLYATSIITEFFRALIEHQIPQQAVLQNLLIKHILDLGDHNTFHLLLQYHVLTENADLARTLINLGSASSGSQKPFEPAFQAGLDMLKKLKSYDEIVVALINEGLALRALNFAQSYNVHSMKLSSFLEEVESLKESGRAPEAEILLKRITEVKKYDEVKSRQDQTHKHILVEE